MISFTKKGRLLSESIRKKLGGENSMEVRLFTKYEAYRSEACPEEQGTLYIDEPVGEWAGEQLEQKNALLFIGACGIAVRSIAPYLTDKLKDSPVLVMDEKGRYVIPILSGHMGGANELAVLLAGATGAKPVITTATDLNEKFAVDLFAKRNRLSIANREGIGKVSAKILEGKEITIAIEAGHREENGTVPEGVRVAEYPPLGPVDVVISSEKNMSHGALFLRPREYVIGIGCKRGIPTEKIEELISWKIKELGISVEQIFAAASVSQKRNEQGIIAWCRKEGIPFLTYSPEELQKVEGAFKSSSFVKDTVGVGNVCERAAVRGCEGEGRLIAPKWVKDGVTIAVARRKWSVKFYEK